MAVPWFGLANRLKVLVSCGRLAEATGRTLRLCWQPVSTPAGAVDVACNCALGDLFEPPLPVSIEESEIRSLVGRRVLVDGEPLDPDDPAPAVVVRFTWRFVPLRGEPFIDLERRFDDPAAARLRDALLPYLRRLVPVASVREAVARIADEGVDRDAVGIHVRRTDHAAATAVSTDAAFTARLDALVHAAPATRLFLATDDPATETRLRGRYGRRLVVAPRASLDRRDPEALRAALVDLLLLARTGRLLGSHGSSFTELAWWLGGCEASLMIAGEPDPP